VYESVYGQLTERCDRPVCRTAFFLDSLEMPIPLGLVELSLNSFGVSPDLDAETTHPAKIAFFHFILVTCEKTVRDIEISLINN